jgi:hypothetical protein
LLASCREFGVDAEQQLAAAPADDDGGDPFAG